MGFVVGQVAFLTHCFQVGLIAIFGLMIQVGNGQNDLCESLFPFDNRVVVNAAHFAFVGSPNEPDVFGNPFPVLRVSGSVFGLNWHGLQVVESFF